MYALGESPNVTSAKSVVWASLVATPSGFIPGEMQAPSLKPFFVSFTKAGDASWLADDVVTLDEDTGGC
jgi:hypothetical protein